MNQRIEIERVCKTLHAQARGLMFSRKKTALFIFRKEKKVIFHTWFVFYPIHFILLDKNKRVVEIKDFLKPFSTYRTKVKTKYVIESPYKINTVIGRTVGWKRKRGDR